MGEALLLMLNAPGMEVSWEDLRRAFPESVDGTIYNIMTNLRRRLAGRYRLDVIRSRGYRLVEVRR